MMFNTLQIGRRISHKDFIWWNCLDGRDITSITLSFVSLVVLLAIVVSNRLARVYAQHFLGTYNYQHLDLSFNIT